jgi:hypothetical protein
LSVSYSLAFPVNAAADHPQDKASASRVENLNPGVKLGPGLKILLCNRFNPGLKLFMRKNEGFFLLLGINAENLQHFNPRVE